MATAARTVALSNDPLSLALEGLANVEVDKLVSA